MPCSTAGVVEDGAGAVPRGGHEVAVDLVGDLNAVVAEPAGDLGDRDAFGQTGREQCSTMLSGSACNRPDAAPVLAALLSVALAATFRHLLQPDQLAHPGT
jgi:hypothetical protein